MNLTFKHWQYVDLIPHTWVSRLHNETEAVKSRGLKQSIVHYIERPLLGFYFDNEYIVFANLPGPRLHLLVIASCGVLNTPYTHVRLVHNHEASCQQLLNSMIADVLPKRCLSSQSAYLSSRYLHYSNLAYAQLVAGTVCTERNLN